ncbi:hypothetical protein ColLi_13329 [Colletotrichum liriopes]|uniref:Uncharacterized protein n=1 Tax=Colletotrichum liriopes TaxID=708192 RepID=A0AA37M0G1_9PEZI|nr:hypothetical protein ColLi_13329 [Colletotrichum liriopes]
MSRRSAVAGESDMICWRYVVGEDCMIVLSTVANRRSIGFSAATLAGSSDLDDDDDFGEAAPP